jgi:hypothetical protein
MVSLLAGGPVFAASLKWQTTEIHLQAGFGQKQVVAAFPFRNTGVEPVHIVSVVPSCSCLTAESGKEIFLPGEAGEIRAEFVFAENVGHQIKTIAVTTDDPSGRATVLKLIVDIPQPVDVSLRFLFWRAGSAPEEKTIEIVLTAPAQMERGELQCSNPLFVARLEAGSGGRYRLLVKPADTQQPAAGTIGLRVTIAGQPQVYQIYVAVK